MKVDIELMGAPGSGKSQIARNLVLRGGFSAWTNVGHKVEGAYDQAMGVSGSYREDLWAFFTWLSLKATNSQERVVYTGSLFDILAHSGAQLESTIRGLQTPQTEQELIQRQGATAVLTMLLIDAYSQKYPDRLKFLFYLPYPEEKPEDTTQMDYEFGKLVDKSLREILAEFGMFEKVQKLRGTTDQNVDEIIETVNKQLATLGGHEAITDRDRESVGGNVNSDGPAAAGS